MLSRFKFAVNKWPSLAGKFIKNTTTSFYNNEQNKILVRQFKAFKNIEGYTELEQYSKNAKNGFINYIKELKGSAYTNTNGIKRSIIENAKYTFKRSPIYLYKGLLLGTKYGIYVGYNFLTKTKPGKAILIGIGTWFSGRALYVYGTKFEKDIVIVKTFNRIGENESDGINEYMITDEDSKIYIVRNSSWYGQWWSTELWSSLVLNRRYHITGYGIRIAAFGIYPTIIFANLVDK